ncbi:hypothetical protein jhhlp_005404 [Lomentospora prolificans]|uniref:Uncharacterized protein n=1 Tax=Lomentospora prolificans TaxID=41688 RepID=A0A2N3N6R8_9PEZI|nr:hypothetical protein jhhlp_005404 [Lomentospora prolificans]
MYFSSFRLLSIACILTSLFSSSFASPLAKRSRSKKCYDKNRNFNTISSIYNLTVYPNQIPIITRGGAGVPPGLFNENVNGRVDPVGDFEGFEHSIEYFFSLAPLPQGNPAKAAITSYKIVEFSSGCRDVAASVVYLYCSVVDPGGPDHGKALAPLKQVAFWKFDEEGAVLKYDAWIPRLDDWVAAITGSANNTQYQEQSIQSICAVSQLTCTGANRQWSSVEECITTLSRKPFGKYQDAWGDNIVCRTIHIVLTQVRPDVHCPHVGPTGGGKCVDVEYPENYFNDEDLYGDDVGDTFTCK